MAVIWCAESYKIFIPSPLAMNASLKSFKGKSVTVTGIAYQFCQRPPYNHNFQTTGERPGGHHYPGAESLSFAHYPGGGAGPDALRRLFAVEPGTPPPQSTRAAAEDLQTGRGDPGRFIRHRHSQTPVRIAARHSGNYARPPLRLQSRRQDTRPDFGDPDDGKEPASISLSVAARGTRGRAPSPASITAPCWSFPISTAARFPWPAKTASRAPRSLLFVPMHAQSQVVGVLELDQDDRVRDFSADEQELSQHLGNQIGVAAPPARPALGAGAALPVGETGGRGAPDLGRGQRAADPAGLDFGSRPPRTGTGAHAARRNARSRPSPPRPRRPPPWWRGWSRSPRPNR